MITKLQVRTLRERRDALLAAWIGLLVGSACVLAGSLFAAGYRVPVGNLLPIVLLAGVALAAERQSIRLSNVIQVSISSIVFVFAAVVVGPLGAMAVGAAGLLADLPRKDAAQPILRWLTWTASRAIVAGCAGLAAVGVLGRLGNGFLAIFAAVSAALAVESLLDIAISATTPVVRGTGQWMKTIESLAPAAAVTLPIHAPTISILAYAYLQISPWSVALFAAPALAAQRLLLLYRQQRLDTEALGLANARLARAKLTFATALVATQDARDRYTAGHSAAVATYARDIAERMSLPVEQQELVHLCGLVHDVGKIGLPAGLLEKPGALSLEERRQMEQHSVIGERILRNVDDYSEIAAVVRHHHERVDGNGYPDQLEADSIPLLARIISVADAYNAMTSDRPYRDAMPSRVARLRLAQAVGSQFDTSVVAAFEAILATATEEYRMGQGAGFVFQSPIPEHGGAAAQESSKPHRVPAAAVALR